MYWNMEYLCIFILSQIVPWLIAFKSVNNIIYFRKVRTTVLQGWSTLRTFSSRAAGSTPAATSPGCPSPSQATSTGITLNDNYKKK